VILDTKGNIFGGFTPVKWESGSEHGKADDSRESFLFTLKNPHNLPARSFGMKSGEKNWAIGCDSAKGPWFDAAIVVYDNCNSRADNFSTIGNFYTNDTKRDGNTIFTGSRQFQVQEIEVFELTD
jgi:hypothetical protein